MGKLLVFNPPPRKKRRSSKQGKKMKDAAKEWKELKREGRTGNETWHSFVRKKMKGRHASNPQLTGTFRQNASKIWNSMSVSKKREWLKNRKPGQWIKHPDVRKGAKEMTKAQNEYLFGGRGKSGRYSFKTDKGKRGGVLSNRRWKALRKEGLYPIDYHQRSTMDEYLIPEEMIKFKIKPARLPGPVTRERLPELEKAMKDLKKAQKDAAKAAKDARQATGLAKQAATKVKKDADKKVKDAKKKVKKTRTKGNPYHHMHMDDYYMDNPPAMMSVAGAVNAGIGFGISEAIAYYVQNQIVKGFLPDLFKEEASHQKRISAFLNKKTYTILLSKLVGIAAVEVAARGVNMAPSGGVIDRFASADALRLGSYVDLGLGVVQVFFKRRKVNELMKSQKGIAKFYLHMREHYPEKYDEELAKSKAPASTSDWVTQGDQADDDLSDWVTQGGLDDWVTEGAGQMNDVGEDILSLDEQLGEEILELNPGYQHSHPGVGEQILGLEDISAADELTGGFNEMSPVYSGRGII